MAGQPRQREGQQDFSAGMFRGVAPSLIPANGAYDIVGLLEEDGAVAGRGGSSARSTSDTASGVEGMWDGFVGSTRLTVFWSTAHALYTLNDDDTVTNRGAMDPDAVIIAPAAIGGKLYFPAEKVTTPGSGVTFDGTTFGAWTIPAGIDVTREFHVAVAGNRLWVGQDETLVFSDRDTPGTFQATSIHKINGGKILRLVGFRDSLVAFTTRGVWRLSNIVYNLTDSVGNVQHRIDQMSQDVVPWLGRGVVTWAGGLIVAALDGVWELPLGVQGEPLAQFTRISDGIATYYRSFAQGPGQGAVYRGHLLLPMAGQGSPNEVLVCRLDQRGRPWARMGGDNEGVNAMGVLLTRVPAAANEEPELLGAFANESATNGKRILDVNWFDAASDQSDADGGTPVCKVTTRDIPTGPFNVSTAVKVRLSYELEGASASIGASWSVGSVDDPTSSALSGSAPEDPEGVDSYSWSLRKRCKFIRYTFTSSGAFSRLKIRAIESFSRGSARS